MAYVNSSGKTVVSLSEASSGHAAQTTASRDAAGNVVAHQKVLNTSGLKKPSEQQKQQKQNSKANTAAWYNIIQVYHPGQLHPEKQPGLIEASFKNSKQ
ncbi:hypothetical protein [Methanosarcina horonobensis]|uniref:hypothetical protein n=1 Tax=Methanosarcina horonobensis TaxID=418008 RepID=UPI000B03D12F|nr:hypothetical protein [Methanosarcina horonobensis]